MQVATIGLDLAKNVFQVHGVADAGSVAFNRRLPEVRSRLSSRVCHCAWWGSRCAGQPTTGCSEVRTQGPSDPASLREALCEARRVGCNRCRGDLR